MTLRDIAAALSHTRPDRPFLAPLASKYCHPVSLSLSLSFLPSLPPTPHLERSDRYLFVIGPDRTKAPMVTSWKKAGAVQPV